MENIRIKKISVPEDFHPLEQIQAFEGELKNAWVLIDRAIIAGLENASLANKGDNGIYTLEPWGGSGNLREFSKDWCILVDAKFESGSEYKEIPQEPDRILMFTSL